MSSVPAIRRIGFLQALLLWVTRLFRRERRPLQIAGPTASEQLYQITRKFIQRDLLPITVTVTETGRNVTHSGLDQLIGREIVDVETTRFVTANKSRVWYVVYGCHLHDCCQHDQTPISPL